LSQPDTALRRKARIEAATRRRREEQDALYEYEKPKIPRIRADEVEETLLLPPPPVLPPARFSPKPEVAPTIETVG
jgi:hypothetical protein